MPKKKAGKKKKGKKVIEYDYKYPQYDFVKLKEVQTMDFLALNSDNKNADRIEGKVPIDGTPYLIKEQIAVKYMYSVKNLRLFVQDGNEKRYLDDILYKPFKEIGIAGNKFNLFYEFEPFVHPTLEASISG